MKNILFLFVMLPLFVFAQDVKDEHESKINVFLSEIGVKTKFIDYKLDNLSGNGGILFVAAETCVRKVIRGEEVRYFYRIEPKRDGADNPVAFIEYSDLKKLKDALVSLKNDFQDDMALVPDYLENKFVTEDYFYVGYYIKKKKATWFIQLDRYGTNKYVWFNSSEPIEVGINKAIDKIEELLSAEIEEL